jgi:hypothetical protein
MKQWDLRGVTVDVNETEPPGGTVNGVGGTARVLLDQFPALLWTTDADLRLTSSLGAKLTELGFGPNQLVGMTLFDFFEAGPDDGPSIMAHRRALCGESVTYDMDWAGRPFHAHVAPLRDSMDRCIGTVCVALDAPPQPLDTQAAAVG